MKNIYVFILMALVAHSKSTGQILNNESKSLGLVDRLDNYLSASASNGLNGAVLIAKGQEIILHKGYGWANRKKNIENNTETIFDICSVSKQFTGAAILKLEEEGKLKLTNPLHLYFEDLPSDKANITIHQLLTHTAGFSHGIGDGDFDHIPEAEYFNELFSTKLRFKPGEKYSYSNSGYSILGKIIEKVSGKSYESFLQEKLFAPAGMTQTGYILPNWNLNNVANEYVYNVIDKGNHVDQYLEDGKIAWPLVANGGVNSTLHDMFKWHLALRNNKVLNEASMEKLTTPYVLEYEGESSYYAYGWTVYRSNRDTKVVTHNGFNGVSYFEFIWFPEEDALILFASNAYTRESARIPYELRKMLFDDGYTAKPISENVVSRLLGYTETFSGKLEELTEGLREKFGENLDRPFYLNRLSGIYFREGEMNKAIVVSELNSTFFPNDGNVWDTLGDIYFAAGMNDKALKSYKKALELKPDEECDWCENSSAQIERIINPTKK
ncbi:serine hydrolase [Flagellimonas sp.]|uniref:serine hydrolase n=1 Tax=Flagellimonas sp. TaxID=2058762 RepID=UPI003BAAB227